GRRLRSYHGCARQRTGTLVSTSASRTFLVLMWPPPPSSTLFPYTTLFRSRRGGFCRRRRYRRRRHGAHLDHGRRSQRRRCACDRDRKSTRLNSSHSQTSYAVFCLKKKKHH